MSQLVAPKHTVVDHIPLGRRIAEIMQEKGSAYTINAMAKRLDISRETLRLMLKGEREIYYFELEKIAKDLKVSVERILQSDVEEKRKRFDEMISSHTEFDDGAILTDQFLQSAIGLTERFAVLNKKGIYWNERRDYLQRHETWLEALSIAWSILEKYDDSESLLRITANLSFSYASRKEKIQLLDLISKVKKYFNENPQQSGIICFSLGRIEESEGNLDRALHTFYEYLDFMERTKIPNQIMKARSNLGFFEYRMKNYQKSIEFYKSTMELFEGNGDMYAKCNYYQCFARSYIRVNEFEQAERLLLIAQKIIESIPVKSEAHKIYEEQIYFLLAIAKKEPRYAEKLVEGDGYNINIKKITCKFLIDYYEEVGNSEAKEKYEKINRQRFTAIDLLLYEKDHCIQYLLTLVDVLVMAGWN